MVSYNDSHLCGTLSRGVKTDGHRLQIFSQICTKLQVCLQATGTQQILFIKCRVCKPATHPDLIGISRFFSANLEVSRFPDFTSGNPGFLFRFGRLTLLHGPCHQAHQAWAKNKFYDRLNPLHNATQGYPRLTMAPASHA